jgi:hypothetical protein
MVFVAIELSDFHYSSLYGIPRALFCIVKSIYNANMSGQ